MFLESDRLFLKRLPLIQNTKIIEELRFSYLTNNYLTNYYELGYSLRNIFAGFFFEIGVGFENPNSLQYGVKLGNSITNMIKRAGLNTD